MSDGVFINIEAKSDELDRAISQVKNLETALQRVSVGKITKELDNLAKQADSTEKKSVAATEQITKTLQQLETQSKSTAGQYAASFGHLGPEIRKSVDATRSLKNAVKDLERVMQTSHKTSATYRSALEEETKLLRTKSAQLTANAEASKRTVETNNRLRAELKQLSTEEGNQTAILKAKLTAEQALQKAQAESLTINQRQQAQAQQLSNRQAELNTRIGKANLILKEQIKGQERQITFSARQANAAAELAQRVKYLNTEEGKNSIVLKEQIKQKEMLAGLETKRRNELTNLRKEVSYLSTEEGKQTAILKERAKYKQQVAALEEKRSNTLKMLRRESAYLNTEEARTAAIYKENIKHKAEMLGAETRRANSLKSLRAELQYVQSAEGQKAARIRENIKHEQEMAAAETKRLNTLARLRADLTAMESTTGRAIATAQQQIRIQKELDAAEAKRVATIAQLKAASSETAQAQQREIELLRRKNELTQRELQVDARKVTLAQEQTVRLREINNQIAAVQTSTGRMIATKERELQIIRRLQSENRLYAQSLVGIQVNLEKVRLAKEAANQATAGFRAGIMGAGASFGIFTSSTILTATAVYSVVRAFRTSIAAGVEFEAQLDRVNAVMDRTGVNSAALAARTRSLAEQTIFTANEVGQGMLYLGMAGMSTNDALIAIEPSLRLASIGMLDMGTTADIVTNILFGFGLQASELELLVDRMAHAITDSNMDIQQLGNAMSYVAPLAREADMSIEELVASLQVLHNTGIKASRAGTAMRTTMLSLMAPTEKAMTVLRKYDIAVDDHNGRMRNWTELLKELAGAQLSLGEVENLVGKRQAAAFKAMIDSASATRQWKNEIQQADPALANINTQLDYYIDRLQHSKGTAEEMQATLEDNLRGDWMKLVSAVQEKYIDFFNEHREGYRAMVQDVTEFIRSLDMDSIQAWFTKIVEGMTKVLQVIAAVKVASMGFSAGAFGGTVIGGGIGGAIGMVGGPAGMMAGAAAGGSIGAKIGTAVGGAAGATAAGAYTYNKAGEIRDSILGIFEDAEDAIDSGVRNAIRRYEDHSNQQLRLIREQRTAALTEAETLLVSAQEGLERAVKNGTQGAIDSFETQVRSIIDTIDELNSAVLGIDKNLASRGQLVGSLEDLKATYEGYQQQVMSMVSSYNALPEDKRPEWESFQRGLQDLNTLAETAKQQYNEVLNAHARSEELKNEAMESDRNRSLEAIENGQREIDMVMGRVSAQAQLNEAYAERRKLEQELRSQIITLEDGSEVPRSAIMTEDIMARKVKNAEQIVRLERQVSSEHERQVQAAQRLTERQANTLQSAENTLAASKKQLREALSFNDAVEHRNKMFERGYLLLDDQDYQFVRQIEHQEEILTLLESELLIRTAAKDSTEAELRVLEENVSVQKGVLEAIKAQRQARLENVNLESDAYRMAVLHKNALDQMYSTIESSTVRLMESGFRDTKNFFDSIVAQFKRMLAELAYQATIKPIIVNVVSSMGAAVFGQQAAQSFAAGQGVELAGAGGSALSMGQLASAGWNLFSGGGSSASMAAMGTRIATSSFGQMVGLSSSAPLSAAAGVGMNSATIGVGQNVAGGIGGAVAPTAAGNFLSTGMSYSPWGIVGSLGSGLLGINGAENPIVDMLATTGGSIVGGGLGASIGMLGSFGGPIGAIAGAVLGKALGGLTSSIFGGSWRSRGGGVELGINQSGVTGRTYEDQRRSGGWFRSSRSRTIYGSLGSELTSQINDALWDAREGITPLAEVLGGQSAYGYTSATRRLAISGDNGSKVIQDWLENQIDRMAEYSAPGLGAYRAADEKLIQTLERLATSLLTVNGFLENIGTGVLSASTHSGHIASEIIKTAGGQSEYTTAANSFYQNFFSGEEITANAFRQLHKVIGDLGLSVPETAEAYRDLVASQNLYTEAGRKNHVELLNLAEVSATYYQTIEQWREELTQGFGNFALRLPTETEMDAWLNKLKTGQMTLTEVMDQISEIAQDSARVLNDTQQSELFDLVMGITDGYAYTLKLLEEEHNIRLANIAAQVRFLENVRNIANSLTLSNLSPLTPQERLVEARSQYDALVSQLESGNYANAGNLQSVAQAFLTEASNVFASSEDYLTIFAEVMAQLSKFEADMQALPSVEDRQQASLDLFLEEQERATSILEQQLEMAGRQVDSQMTLLDVIRNLPPELAISIAEIIGNRFMDDIPQNVIMPNGSHSAGLAYVPYDGYTAVLHKGEEVVPASVRKKDEATKEMVAELRYLRAEFSKLREEQRRHKEDMVNAQFASTDAAATKTLSGNKQITREAEWERKREIKLK